MGVEKKAVVAGMDEAAIAEQLKALVRTGGQRAAPPLHGSPIARSMPQPPRNTEPLPRVSRRLAKRWQQLTHRRACEQAACELWMWREGPRLSGRLAERGGRGDGKKTERWSCSCRMACAAAGSTVVAWLVRCDSGEQQLLLPALLALPYRI
jgi:hypothetical protein